MITVNLYYKGINGNARAFADEMEISGIADVERYIFTVGRTTNRMGKYL